MVSLSLASIVICLAFSFWGCGEGRQDIEGEEERSWEEAFKNTTNDNTPRPPLPLLLPRYLRHRSVRSSKQPPARQLPSAAASLLPLSTQDKTRHNIRRTLFSSHRAPCPSRQDRPPSRGDVDGPRPHDGTTILARQYRQHHKARRTVSVSYCLQPRPLDAIPTCPALARRVASSRSA